MTALRSPDEDDASGKRDASGERDASDERDAASGPSSGLWSGDAGVLAMNSRRALLVLLRGPYLSYRRHAQLWSALLRDETAIRSRLNELFLDLVVDGSAEIAYVRNADPEQLEVPKVLRAAPLKLLDSAMLLILRQHLVSVSGTERVIIGREDIDDQLAAYRPAGMDDSGFRKRIDGAWANMKRYGLISDLAESDRVEISPVLQLVFGPEQIAALRHEYTRLRVGAGDVGGSDDDADVGDGADADTNGEEAM